VHKADLVPIGTSVVALIHNELRAESLPWTDSACSIRVQSSWPRQRAALCWAT
jgi:hypothetical protein